MYARGNDDNYVSMCYYNIIQKEQLLSRQDDGDTEGAFTLAHSSISTPVDFCRHLVGKNSKKCFFFTVIALKYASQ